MNPPPLRHRNPSETFHKEFEFHDNVFKNNIMAGGPYRPHTTWTWQKRLAGKPVALTAMGLIEAVRFEGNAFHAEGAHADELIYVHDRTYPPAGSPAALERKYPKAFARNTQQTPEFVSPDANDFRLAADSPLIDVGVFLTVTVGKGDDSREMRVADAGYFFDGFGIEGEEGDLVQLQGQTETAKVVSSDYARNTLTLDAPLSWREGQGISLAYAGEGPDVGRHEREAKSG